MNLKKSKEEYMEGFGGRKGKYGGNDLIILESQKITEILFKIFYFEIESCCIPQANFELYLTKENLQYCPHLSEVHDMPPLPILNNTVLLYYLLGFKTLL